MRIMVRAIRAVGYQKSSKILKAIVNVSLLNKKWILSEPSAEKAETLVRELKLSPLLAKL